MKPNAIQIKMDSFITDPRVIACQAFDCIHHDFNNPIKHQEDKTFNCSLKEVRISDEGTCVRYEPK